MKEIFADKISTVNTANSKNNSAKYEEKLEEIKGGTVSVICFVGAGFNRDKVNIVAKAIPTKVSKYYREIRCSESDQITQQCCFRGSF